MERRRPDWGEDRWRAMELLEEPRMAVSIARRDISWLLLTPGVLVL